MSLEVGQWYLYQWFDEDGMDCIRPDDLNDIRHLRPNGKLFKCLGTNGDFAILQHNVRSYRVKPKQLAKTIPVPAFEYGDVVLAMSGGEQRRGVIREIMWHFQRNEPFFLLAISGKAISRRYWASELCCAT
jgi:hypothetical protein